MSIVCNNHEYLQLLKGISVKHLMSLSSLALIAALGVSLSACSGSPFATATAPIVEPLTPNTSSVPAEPAKSPRGNFIKEVG